MSTIDPLIGRTLNNKYQILEKIGVGGQSRVYKAKELTLNRLVALKCIVEDIDPESSQAKRFTREAQDLARLRHQNVVTVFESGHDGNVFFIAMEYLEGLNLAQLVKRDGKLDELSTLRYMAPLADALDHIHDSDLVHSDVKSSNIIIDKSGRPVLMDLGIAIQTDKTIMDGGNVLGTPEFMSPEQSKGDALDERSDLYSLGVVMYQCLTGRVPFHGKNYSATSHMVINQEPTPPIELNSDLSEGCNALIINLLSKNKYDRIPTARDLSGKLKEILNTSDPAHKTVVTQKKDKKHKKKDAAPENAVKTGGKRKRILIVLLMFLFMMLIIIPVGLYFYNSPTSPPPPPPPPPHSVLTAEQSKLLAVKAEQYFLSGDYVMAFRFYNDIRNRASDYSSIKEAYLKARMELVQHMLNQITLVPVKGGAFSMGQDLPGQDDAPAHEVSVSDFMLSSTEITLKVYLEFLNAMKCDASGMIGDKNVLLTNHKAVYERDMYNIETFLFDAAKEGNLPAFGVPYAGAKMFCEFLGGRLPTEAEWEYAARQGQAPGASSDPYRRAWFAGNAKTVKPVGVKESNMLGLFDMAGNVWEWCADFYAETYYSNSPTLNPVGPEKGQVRVIRGGDILSSETLLNPSYRSFMDESSLTNDYIGFRLCK